MRSVKLSSLFAPQVVGVDPRTSPDEEFELWSIPSYDLGCPEIVKGSEVGSIKKEVEPNDVLLSRIVPHIRRSWVVSPRNGRRQIASGEWIVFRNHDVDPRYLRHFLISDLFHAQFMQTVAGVGGSLLRARPEGVGAIKAPLPTLDEQRRIATILDQADDLRRRRQEALERLKDLLEADFAATFVTANDDAGWPERTVEGICTSIRTGPFGSQLLHSEFVDDGIAVLGIDNAVRNEFTWGERRYITPEKYRKLARFRVYPQDVIVTIMGTCGRVAIVPNDIPCSISTKHLCCLTLDSHVCTPEYLHACFLRHPSVLQQLGVRERGAVMPGLNMQLIKQTKLPIPPIELQHAFAARVAQVELLKRKYRAQLAGLDGLFSSLQYRAFRGEL